MTIIKILLASYYFMFALTSWCCTYEVCKMKQKSTVLMKLVLVPALW